MAEDPAVDPLIVRLRIPYEFLVGDDIVDDGISDENTMLQILHWIGFRTEQHREALVADCFGSFEDLRVLTEKDVTTMSSDFGGRQARERIHFGTRRTKSIKGLVHWVQDFYRVSELPSIVGLNEITFKQQLERALARADIRSSLKNQASTAADAATPGALKSEKQWKEWEEKFINYARSQLGSNGIPLSYVIRENEQPDTDAVHPDFVNKTIACAPLAGEYYSADRLAVFNFIVSFTTGQPSGDWIKNTLKFADGRRSMQALRDHFSGEGNATRNVAEADRLKESLHYKSERAMSFETFLTQCQKMYNIYDKEGEPMTDEAKVRFLFKRVQHDKLTSSIDALKAQITAGVNVSYTMAANHLSAAVSELPDYLAKNRNISGVGNNNTNGNEGDSNAGIYNADGSIKTGFISNWKSLSKDDRAKVIAERKRLGIRGGKGGRNSNNNNNNDSGASNTLKQLKQQNKKYRRQIKAMKRVRFEDDKTDGNNDNSDADDDDAGDQFGGKASKKKLKAKK